MRIDPSMVYRKFQNGETSKALKSDKGASGSTYKEGDTLKGEIVDANQNKVSIRLSDGQTLTARLATANTFSIGDTVAFTIKESQGDQLLLSPLMDEGAQANDQLLSILSEAGLPKSEENSEMVRQLMDQKMPVDQASLKEMVRLMTKYPETPVRQLVFLTKNQLPVNEGTIQQLTMLENKEQPLMQSMATMVDDLTSVLSMKTASMTSEALPLINDQEQVVLASITEDGRVIGFQKEINQLMAVTSDQIKSPVESHEGKTTQPIANEGQAQVPISDMVLGSDTDRLGTALVKLMEVNLAGTSLTNHQTEVLNQLPEFEQMTLQDLGKLGAEGFISHEQLRDVLQDIKQASTYQALAKGLLLSEIKTIEAGEVTNYFNKVQEKVEQFIHHSSESIENTDVAKDAADVKASVEFLNNLQQEYNFMHLPMFLNDQLLNSELYIMNNQKTSKDAKQSITALVRLDLKNLGHTDIYVKKSEKNVDIQFYMTDKQQMDLVREQVFQLHKLLTTKGFKVLSATVQSLDKEFDLVDDFLASDEEKKDHHRYTFDMKA